MQEAQSDQAQGCGTAKPGCDGVTVMGEEKLQVLPR